MKECRYEDPSYDCQEPAYAGTPWCILHLEFPSEQDPEFDTIQRLKRKKTQEKIASGNLEFRGAKIYEIDAHDKSLYTCDLTRASIRGFVWFDGANINGNVLFDKAQIERAYFNNVTIHGDVSFGKAIIEKTISFREATIEGNFWFMVGTVRDGVDFVNATIKGHAFFDELKIGGPALFGGVTVEKSAHFNAAKMGRVVSFYTAKLKGDAYFTGASFAGEASFGQALVGGNASFDVAETPGSLSFDGTTFSHFQAAEAAYRAAKQNCEQRGDRIGADGYFYKEMVARRNKNDNKLYCHFERLFLDWPMKYGTSPSRLFVTWILLAAILGGLTAASLAFTSGLTVDSGGLAALSLMSVFAPGLSLAHAQPNLLVWVFSIISTIVAAFFWGAFILVFSRRYMR